MKAPLIVSHNYRDVSFLRPSDCELRLYEPCARLLPNYYGMKYLQFPHLLFARVPVKWEEVRWIDDNKSSVLDKKSGVMLFVGATDSSVSFLLQIPIRQIFIYAACLGQRQHFVYPSHTTMNHLLELFWNTQSDLNCSKWPDCKTPAEALHVFEYGNLSQSSYRMQDRNTLDEFLTMALERIKNRAYQR